VVYTARLDYFPNVLAAEVLLRDIAPALAPVPVVVAGAQPDASLYEVPRPANAAIVADPESMTEIRRDAVMAVPLTHGGGSRFKLIEAFAEGLPVISTLKGAEGLGAEPDRHYLRAETAEEFVTAVRRLQTDDELRDAVVRAGWELARDGHSQQALTRQLAELL
jgi:glycosyltransferase involved in cell wall biosynthesis